MMPNRGESQEEKCKIYHEIGKLIVQDHMGHRHQLGFCDKHGKLCNVHDQEPVSESTFRIFDAGSPCWSWSAYGHREQEGHFTMIGLYTWIGDILSVLPDAWIHECTPQFQPAILLEYLGRDYEIITMLLDQSVHFGVPALRKRRWTIGLRRQTIVSLQPWDRFIDILGCSLVATPDIFFCAGKDTWYWNRSSATSVKENKILSSTLG